MQLDVQTLSIVTVFVTALLGILLVFAGMQNQTLRAPMVWGAAYLLSALGQLIGSQALVTSWVASIANAMVLLGAAGIWAGSRCFDGRSVRPITVVSAPAFWGLACLVADFRVRSAAAHRTYVDADGDPRGCHGGRILARPRGAADVALADRCRASRLCWGAPFAPAGNLFLPASNNALMGGISFCSPSALLFTVVLAFPAAQHDQGAHRACSTRSPRWSIRCAALPTAAPFSASAERLLARQRLDHEPLALLLFDLDRFKAINDHFGHAAGDACCALSHRPATATLGADVLFGRIGGEEFALVAAGRRLGEAVAIADRVRRNLKTAASSLRRANCCRRSVSASR